MSTLGVKCDRSIAISHRTFGNSKDRKPSIAATNPPTQGDKAKIKDVAKSAIERKTTPNQREMIERSPNLVKMFAFKLFSKAVPVNQQTILKRAQTAIK
ncbi:hypothetical protein H6G00_04395 [Leptolyngbya sp. FACHB-541]|uniref:hypothetical protein n=1 Tax=Leptolyngbya sp. FACHB-541 TaxID=2692810 RepID=UPI00168986DA|nr:hypothetical protein [Leptolyngbya sp. FACHB-541]MBD1995867.1 hypothetical protein [Leptolyngbya sp. FACHB-541]